MNIQASHVNAGQKPPEYSFSDNDFRRIADLALQKFGLNLQPTKKALVYSRLAKRLRARNLTAFSDYCDLIDRADEARETSDFLSALTTNVTHFFREEHHFTYLGKQVLPKLITKARSGQAVRLWSAACSSGQEAYCMAATINAVCPNFEGLDIKILATDIDPKVVAQAKQGVYSDTQITAIPTIFREQMVLQTATGNGSFTIHPKLKSLVSFAELNLIGDWPMRKEFDVIFCRNTAIYFNPVTQHRLWARFHALLAPDGHLMIGHSERIGGPAAKGFRNVDVTTYQKSPSTSPVAN